MRYIDEHFDGPRLMPADPVARERAERWVERIDGLGKPDEPSKLLPSIDARGKEKESLLPVSPAIILGSDYFGLKETSGGRLDSL